MIGKLTGRIEECRPEKVLLAVGGVGYEVEIPLHTYYTVHAAGDAVCSLFVHTHVREDAFQLFGFSSSQEKRAFQTLIGVNGVGPRLALAILSGIGVDELKATVATQDRARLQRIPGVGKKTAERLLLELKDKTGWDDPTLPPAAPAVKPDATQDADVSTDAISALLNLGYGQETAAKAVRKTLDATGDEAPSLQQVLRGALKQLMGN